MRRILGLVVINLLAIGILGLITDYFLTKANIIVMIDNMALEAVALSGYTLLLVGGYFDLSIDGVVSLSGVVAGIAMTHGVPWPIAIVFSFIFSLVLGGFNGWAVARLRINGLIATLTTWWICVGFSLGLTKALAPHNFPDAFQALGQSRILGFRALVVYAIISVTVLSIVLHFTRTGSHIYVSGDNRVSAEFMGINVQLLGIKLYVLVAVLAGLIGVLTASRLNAASPVAVDGMALRVIAAIVIGGGNLSGGRGTIIGGLLGLLLMHILNNAVIQLGLSPYWQKAILGGILLAAVLSEKFNFRLRRIQHV